MKKLTKKPLKTQAEENAQVTKGTSKNQEVLKKGVPNDHSRRLDNSGNTVVGVSIGSTLNMGDYQSLRTDVWLSDTVQEGETPESAAQRIESFIDATLEQAIRNCIEE